MTTQAEIDELLNSDNSELMQSKLKMSKSKSSSKSIKEDQHQQNYQDEFQEYEQTKKFNATTSYKSDFQAESRESEYKNPAEKKNNIKIEEENQDMIQQIYGSNVSVSIPKTCKINLNIEYSQSKQKSIAKKLQIIKQQPIMVKQDQIKKKKQSKIEVKSQKMPVQKKNLPYNFSKLKEIQKEHLLMDLIQQKNIIKQQNNSLKQQLKLFKAKYNALLQEKTLPTDNSREKVLIKQNQVLKQRIESLLNLKKINDAKNSFKNLSKTQPQQTLIIQPEINDRQQDLIKIIDKLKNRLKQSENQIKVLQQKMNDGLDLEQSLKKKVRTLEKVEYKIGKLNEHAQNDRLLIQQLKVKVEQTQKNLEQQKQKNNRLSKQFRRIQLVAATNNDIVKQLQQTRREKNNLQKSLRQLTSNLVSKVNQKNKQASKNLSNIGYIDVLDLDSIR